jgi:hypothetical protein
MCIVNYSNIIMYLCTCCNYKTSYSSNFCKHKKSKKHINNLKLSNNTHNTHIINNNNENNDNNDNNDNNYKCDINDNYNDNYDDNYDDNDNNSVKSNISNKQYKCNICEYNTYHKTSYYRHINKCKNKNLSDVELKMKLEYINKEKNMLRKLDKEKDIIIKEKTNLLNTFMLNANNIINKAQDNTKITAQAIHSISKSALKYANEKFKKTPLLVPIENFNINNLDFNNKKDKKQLVDTLIYNAKQKSLDKLLGDHIIKCYKKDNPEDQVFHTTDCSRLNYIVRELIENALTWSIDKNGLKICKDIVKPLIKKCIDALMEHQKILLQEMNNGNYLKQKDVELIIDIIMSIDSGSLEQDINKYIAPYFNLSKNI